MKSDSRAWARLFSQRERLFVGVAAGATGLIALATVVLLTYFTQRTSLLFATRSIASDFVQQVDIGHTMLTAMNAVGHSDGPGAQVYPRLTVVSQNYLATTEHFDLVAYMPLLSDQYRSAFERQMGYRGFGEFRIADLDLSRKTLVTAEPRPVYLPVSFVEPFDAQYSAFLGLDMAPLAASLLLDDSMRSGQVAILPKPLFGSGTGKLTLLAASYSQLIVPTTVDTRRSALMGAYAMQLDVTSLITDLLAPFPRLSASLISSQANQQAPRDAMLTIDPKPGMISDWAPRIVVDQTLQLGDLNFTLATSQPLYPRLRSLLPGLVVLVMLLSLIRVWQHRRIARILNVRHHVELKQERARAEVTLRSIGDAVVVVDQHAKINYLNPVAERMLACASQEAHGCALSKIVDLVEENSGLPIATNDHELLARVGSPGDLLLKVAGREAITVRASVSSNDGSGSGDVASVLVFHDISRERELTRRLEFHACHDPLTGLKNRRMFEQEVRVALSDSRDRGHQHAILYLDLDQFKIVNDTCGHSAGDELLGQISALFSTQMRTSDLLARLGGDEFGVLLRRCDEKEARVLGERLRSVLTDYRYYADDKVFSIGVSIGAVMIGSDSGTFADLMSAVDLACYAAKDSGRNRLHMYRTGDDAVGAQQSEMHWQAEIQAALEADRFVLFWQPIKALTTSDRPVELREFLVRMYKRDGEMVPPMAFISAAERYDLMLQLDRWVIQRAFRLIGKYADSDRDVQYTINLSGQSIGDPRLVDFVTEELNRQQIPPRLLCFEITETAAISNLKHALRCIASLRALGCSFALDDFGSGLSSFGYLKHLPVDYLKIDAQFVSELDVDEVALEMVKAILGIGRIMSIATIAEGVESQAVLDRLASIGADYVQGYHVAMPELAFPESVVVEAESRVVA